MQTYTKEEKAAHFASLRSRWTEAKEYAKTEAVKAAWMEAQRTTGGTFSSNSFADVYRQMKAQGLAGTPYIDAKTFNGWKASGFVVRKGEHSKLDGLTWLHTEEKETPEGKKDGFVFPKVYNLFHVSQVEAISI